MNFTCGVCPESCVRYGLEMDVATVLWWLQQSDAARLEICKPGEELPYALAEFRKWLGEPPFQVWGNGADFDNVILLNAFNQCAVRAPWKFWSNRCYRTVKNLNPQVPFQKTGTAHNALDDARNQALHLMRILNGAKAENIEQRTLNIEHRI